MTGNELMDNVIFLFLILALLLVMHFIARTAWWIISIIVKPLGINIDVTPPFKPVKLYDLDAYTKDHPHHVINEKVICAHCGGSSIWMQPGVGLLFFRRFKHVCKQCGNVLYYSSQSPL